MASSTWLTPFFDHPATTTHRQEFTELYYKNAYHIAVYTPQNSQQARHGFYRHSLLYYVTSFLSLCTPLLSCGALSIDPFWCLFFPSFAFSLTRCVRYFSHHVFFPIRHAQLTVSYIFGIHRTSDILGPHGTVTDRDH